jgi:hypothetical protein
MWIRILIAALTGGVLVFVMGATNHMAFQLLDRTFMTLPDEAKVADALQSSGAKPGIYSLPGHPSARDMQDEVKMKALNERYKAGPSGVIIVAPTGQDMMTGETLFKEFATNTIAALLAAWVVSLMAPETGFVRRWFAVIGMGLMGWFSLVASYGIWYRFPHDFVHDEFLCALLEWGVAGLAIAAIVRRPPERGVNSSTVKEK